MFKFLNRKKVSEYCIENMESKPSSWFVGVDDFQPKVARRRAQNKRAKSFIDALREKYLKVQEVKTQGYVIVFHGRPKTGNDPAELGYLRNVCLTNSKISLAGVESSGLADLCPNVVDLDLSGNLLESWEEILPIISQLQNLKFVNLARNKIKNNKGYLQSWKKTLPGIENLVLNSTLMKWGDVLRLARLLPQLKELHICDNGYCQLPDTTFRSLEGVECLRMNNNSIESWQEVWKLRYLSSLHTLILSGNPLLDLFFHDIDLDPSCACFCHHDDNVEDDSNRYNNSSKADISDIDIQELINHSNDISSFGGNQEGEENGNHSLADDDVVEAWCQKILDDVIAELIKEGYSALRSQSGQLTEDDSRNTENDLRSLSLKNEDGTAKNTIRPSEILNNRDENTRNKIENLTAGSYIFMNSNIRECNKRSNSESSQCECFCNREDLPEMGFPNLETLCVSETNIGKWRHLSALNTFPSLKSLRIKDVKLGCKLNQEDRRKLFIASLPKIRILNGSEVTVSEREKSERHFLRYFFDKKLKPDYYKELERKHGKLSPLVDIDIGAGYQEIANLDFIYCGKSIFTEAVRVREPVGRLRLLVAEKLCLYGSMKTLRLYHKSCGPNHCDNSDGEPAFDELFLDSLPTSRFDILNGDEIHIDIDLAVWNALTGGHMKYLTKTIRLYHKSCSPSHGNNDEGEPALDELFLDSLPMSRFDILDGDEIHIDIDMELLSALTGGHMNYICVCTYIPKKFGIPSLF